MKWCELFSLYSIVTFVICITRLKCGANYCMFATTTIFRREMMACYAIQSTCVVFLLLINPARTENALGYLSVRNPVFVGGNITLMLIPFYHAFVTDIDNSKLQVLFRKDNVENEMHEAIRSFENGKAFFVEIRNVNKTWNNSAVFFKNSNTESNNVDLTIKDRTEGLLHILSDPTQPEDSAQIAFYPPVGFQDWKQIHQWWPNRYGGIVNDSNKEEIIFTIKIANHRTFFLEYVNGNFPMNISATVVSAHKGVGPPCTNQKCGHCVCVHRGEDFTCSTDGRMLAMWIGSENVDFEQITDTRNEVKQYRPHNGSITKHHHNSTIVCFMEKNGFVFNDSATLIVLDTVQSIVSPDSALTYTLVFTSVLIVALAAFFILVKRHKRSKDRVLGACRRAPTRARDIDQADTMSDDDDDFDSDLSANAQESGRAKFPIEESTGASVTLVYADLDIKFLEQGPHPGPTVKKYEPTQYVEFRAYKTEVTEYGNINMAD
ncbi:uncharacterized protein LOC127873443 isoform X2 [Dreissena polymorpha]|uniref:uncharacterized protein LOC127873443 isoform X2 n=1 Tax=Dreissena polymorpha TaxID=45954 RepID=UPI0022644767|nr:uncharacterized protein LOC127873443 isoform X2 [Dreissena polymorpha]